MSWCENMCDAKFTKVDGNPVGFIMQSKSDLLRTEAKRNQLISLKIDFNKKIDEEISTLNDVIKHLEDEIKTDEERYNRVSGNWLYKKRN